MQERQRHPIRPYKAHTRHLGTFWGYYTYSALNALKWALNGFNGHSVFAGLCLAASVCAGGRSGLVGLVFSCWGLV
ncbi:hypothetical protein Alsa3_CDS0139 [Staphylococcus phage Alsa_3]|nr:hypothetical protein Alsa3_CDS0139 [Staphylococcus phage Alsa_3]WNM51264.1 hypothetical protein Alsa4_CDS0134 [Staphylococcus phage Alsa_4]